MCLSPCAPAASPHDDHDAHSVARLLVLAAVSLSMASAAVPAPATSPVHSPRFASRRKPRPTIRARPFLPDLQGTRINAARKPRFSISTASRGSPATLPPGPGAGARPGAQRGNLSAHQHRLPRARAAPRTVHPGAQGRHADHAISLGIRKLLRPAARYRGPNRVTPARRRVDVRPAAGRPH